MNDQEKDKAFEAVVNSFASTLSKPDITEEDKERIRKNREISTSNLIPAKPGEVRNPNGRPKGKKYISEALKDLLAKDPELLKEVIEAALRQAKKGNIQAFREIADRSEGKVTEVIELDTTPLQEKLARLRGYSAAE